MKTERQHLKDTPEVCIALLELVRTRKKAKFLVLMEKDAHHKIIFCENAPLTHTEISELIGGVAVLEQIADAPHLLLATRFRDRTSPWLPNEPLRLFFGARVRGTSLIIHKGNL